MWNLLSLLKVGGIDAFYLSVILLIDDNVSYVNFQQ